VRAYESDAVRETSRCKKSSNREEFLKNHCDGGKAILEAFRNLGIDYIMSSPRSEWSSVWEPLARPKTGNRPRLFRRLDAATPIKSFDLMVCSTEVCGQDRSFRDNPGRHMMVPARQGYPRPHTPVRFRSWGPARTGAVWQTASAEHVPEICGSGQEIAKIELCIIKPGHGDVRWRPQLFESGKSVAENKGDTHEKTGTS
jgi:hypothetical protein